MYAIIFYFNYTSTRILYTLYYNTIISYILLCRYYEISIISNSTVMYYVYICSPFFEFYNMVLDDILAKVV